jgi:hypothetical protein
MDPTWLLCAALASLIGLAAFVYGRRQRRAAPLVIGVALMVYPYFVSNLWALVGIGVFLIAGLILGSRLEESL